MHPRNPPPRAACTKNGGDSAMPKVLNRVLNAKTIATLTKPGTYADGGGLRAPQTVATLPNGIAPIGASPMMPS